MNGSPPPEARSRRVLIIDDDDSVRRVTGTFLELSGFEVVGVAGGEDGLRILHGDDSIGLVLLDLHMPNMNGLAFRKIQRRDARLAGIPTVVLTGTPPSPVLRDELLAADYLSKPVGREELVSVVSKHCRPGPP